jgi:hypothetical protein
MDPLRFRKRPLFRQQALDAFVGALGHGATPDLLRPPTGRWARRAVLTLLVAWTAWIGAAVILAMTGCQPKPEVATERPLDV